MKHVAYTKDRFYINLLQSWHLFWHKTIPLLVPQGRDKSPAPGWWGFMVKLVGNHFPKDWKTRVDQKETSPGDSPWLFGECGHQLNIFFEIESTLYKFNIGITWCPLDSFFSRKNIMDLQERKTVLAGFLNCHVDTLSANKKYTTSTSSVCCVVTNPT